jgi:uncharacterized protein YecT (DUF1311 family)
MKKVLGILMLFASIMTVNADDCMETAMTQIDITMCSKDKALAMDQNLNTLVDKIDQTLELSQREWFNQSQLSWRTMAENDCLIQRSFYEGGSIAPSIYNSCMELRTEQRIEQIKYFLCPNFWMKGVCEP